MSKDTPKSPDYEAAAEQQGQNSREVTEQQTWANRADQFTPFGAQTWQNQQVWDPSTQQYLNRWAQSTELNPTLQGALDEQMQVQLERSRLAGDLTGRMQNEFGSPMDFSNAPAAGGAIDPRLIDSSQRYYDEAGDAIYNRWADRALPQQARDTDAMRTRLYNMGLSEGDPAFDVEMQKLQQNQGDALRQATYQATIGAGQEASRMYGMDAGAAAQNYGQEMQSSQYENQRRQQAFAEMMQQRGWSLNEINALLHGQQVGMPQMPQYNTAGRADATQYLQAANMQGQANLDAFNAEQAATQGMMSGIGGIAGGMMGTGGIAPYLKMMGG